MFLWLLAHKAVEQKSVIFLSEMFSSHRPRLKTHRRHEEKRLVIYIIVREKERARRVGSDRLKSVDSLFLAARWQHKHVNSDLNNRQTGHEEPNAYLSLSTLLNPGRMCLKLELRSSLGWLLVRFMEPFSRRLRKPWWRERERVNKNNVTAGLSGKSQTCQSLSWTWQPRQDLLILAFMLHFWNSWRVINEYRSSYWG